MRQPVPSRGVKGFESVRFQAAFRDYQRQVLDRLETHRRDGKIHIVAAPGSGKTVLGLELICRLGRPALILAPTLTIRQQWSTRFFEHFLPAEVQKEDWFSVDPRKPSLLTATTYQHLHAAYRRMCFAAREEGEYELGQTEIQYEEFDLMRTLRAANIGTICLDEAHHLRNEWQRSLEEFIAEQRGDVQLISLTATPPYDATPAEWNRYLSLCGEIDEEIFVPQLVAQGTLCPHQDYVYLNSPTPQEAAVLRDYGARAERCVQELLAGSTVSDALLSCAALYDPERHLGWLFEHAEGMTALFSLARHKGLELPKAQCRFVSPGGLPIFSMRVAQVAFQFMLDSAPMFRPEVSESVRAVLAREALLRNGQVKLTGDERIDRAMISSAGKLASIVAIAQSEWEALGDSLRLLVLTDHIRSEMLPAIGGDAEFQVLGLVPIFETLRRALGDRVEIAALSGSLVILPRSGAWKVRELSQGFVPVQEEPIGKTGYSVMRFGYLKDAVAMVGEVFRRGGVQVLVGTQALLGEGWDAPYVNALILASATSSFVRSNQMRGRAIRVDHAEPGKTANIWHLATIQAETEGKEALLPAEPSKDYEMLARRFTGFLGPAYSKPGICNGIERVDNLRPPFTELGIARMNREALAIAADRHGMAVRWSEAYSKDNHPEVLDQSLVPRAVRPTKLLWRKTWTGIGALGMVAASAGLALLPFMLNSVVSMLCVAGLVCIGGSIGWDAYRRIRRFFTSAHSICTFGESLLRSLREAGIVSSEDAALYFDERGADARCVSCALTGGSLREKTAFAAALRELLSPIENPRYLLILGRRGEKRRPGDYAVSFACPSILGSEKRKAALLAKHLGEAMGGMEAVYTRDAKGLTELMQCRSRSYLNEGAIRVAGRQVVKPR